jgi:hypothetical protein
MIADARADLRPLLIIGRVRRLTSTSVAGYPTALLSQVSVLTIARHWQRPRKPPKRPPIYSTSVRPRGAAVSVVGHFGSVDPNEGCEGSRQEDEAARAADRSVMAKRRELGKVPSRRAGGWYDEPRP